MSCSEFGPVLWRPGTVDLLREVGLADRMDRDGHPHDGAAIMWEGRERFFIDTMKYTGKSMMAYGQTALTEDLYAARDAAGGQIVDEAGDVGLHDLSSAQPHVTYRKNGQTHRVDCDYVAGCDGYHGSAGNRFQPPCCGPSRRTYPFGWLGIMSETPPLPDFCYCSGSRGFALASMRKPMLSRYYIQCDLDTRLEDWPDDRFWEEFKARCPLTWPPRSSPVRRSRNRLRRCAASLPSRCATAACSSPAMRRTSSRRQALKA